MIFFKEKGNCIYLEKKILTEKFNGKLFLYHTSKWLNEDKSQKKVLLIEKFRKLDIERLPRSSIES